MAPPPRIAASMKREALLSSAFFRPMRPAEIDEILGFATERRYPRGSTVMAKGEPGSSMMAVLAGRLRVNSISADGREITLNVIGPGELVGEFALLDGKPRSNDVIAVEDTTVMVVERHQFMPFLLRHDTLVERLLVVLCDKLRRTSLALEEIALFDVPERLARLLVKLAADYGRPLPEGEGAGVRIDLKLSQRDLSTLVASTRESVNKQLRVWREEGAIDQRDGYLIVLKPDALQALVA
jgi:CRP/FNR family transcriptional regulator, cyclic AMP receptor protein